MGNASQNLHLKNNSRQQISDEDRQTRIDFFNNASVVIPMTIAEICTLVAVCGVLDRGKEKLRENISQTLTAEFKRREITCAVLLIAKRNSIQ